MAPENAILDSLACVDHRPKKFCQVSLLSETTREIIGPSGSYYGGVTGLIRAS
ncbi:hypothetical protein DPMN_092402 [Dreissena polymorpha]|uniref:Uncharacterized protein n=1 Tax=Dreissena polymorpha TaxID=45954 RepID=A0A9D4L199_DREPO|nr:hypothetical protein DPMN_092402 [Dreissena polymorpha]